MRKLIRVVGIVLLAAALAGIAYPIWWNHRSASSGNALLTRAATQLAIQSTSAPASCPTTVAAATKPIGSSPGVLELPSLGVVAPVLNGLTDAILSVAVGHDPVTGWPGTAGESIVEAHDVSYFAGLSQIHPGDSVIWITPCAREQFQVVSTAVRQPGQLLYAPAGGAGLALVTCYPTNALFWTSNRFVVTTRLVKSQLKRQSVPTPNIAAPQLTVDAPSALVAEGLQLSQNSLLMGVMHLTGTPSSSFVNGPGPLSVEAQALEVFFGAEKAVAQRNRSWWSDLALASVPFPSAWPPFGQTNVTISVAKNTPTAVTISSGSSSITIVNLDNVLLISSLS